MNAHRQPRDRAERRSDEALIQSAGLRRAIERLDSAPATDLESAELLASWASLLGDVDAPSRWERAAELLDPADPGSSARLSAMRYSHAGRDIDTAGVVQHAATADRDKSGWGWLCAAIEHSVEGRWSDALSASEFAVAAATERDDAQLLSRARNIEGISMSYLGNTDQAVNALREAVRAGDACNDLDAQLRARLNLVETLAEGDSISHALASAFAAADIAAMWDLPGWKSEAGAVLAWLLAQSGDLSEAARVARETLELEGAYHDDYVAFNCAFALLDGGCVDDEIRSLVERAEARAQESGFASFLFLARLARVQLTALTEGLDPAVQIASDLWVDEPQSMLRLGLQVCRMGAVLDHAPARDLAAALLEKVGAPGDYVSQLAAAEISATLSSWESREDLDSLAQAAAAWGKSGRKLDESRALISYAACMIANGLTREASSNLARLQRRLIEAGALADAAAVAHLLDDLAGGAASPVAQPDVPLLEQLSDSDRAAFLELGVHRTVPEEHTFFEAGDRCSRLWLVESGSVRLYRSAPDGREVAVDLLGKGAVFGHLSLEPASSTGLAAEASSEARVWQLEQPALREAVRRWPQLGAALLELMEQRLTAAHEVVADLAFLGVDQRLARLLARLDDRFGHPRLDGTRIINIALTHEQIARMIGTRRKRVTTALGALRDAGIIDTDKRRIVLLDRDRLIERIDSAE